MSKSTWVCSAALDLPLDTGAAPDDAAGAIFSLAGFDGADPDTSLAATGFLLHDSASPSDKSSYMMPFTSVVDNALAANQSLIEGINTDAMGNMDMPGSVSDAVGQAIETYSNRFDEASNGDKSTSPSATGTMSFGGVSIRAAQPTDGLLALAKAGAMDPSVFETNHPFFVSTSISTNRIDSYFTRMRPSSLANYAKDAAEGRSVLVGHDHNSLGVGYSITGKYIAGNNARVESDFYTIQGLPDTDQAILRIRAGLVRDTSIGFMGGSILCSICGRDWWDWDCMHIPGVEYPSDPAKPNQNMQVAIGDVENAHIAEYSLVFDGSTPGAGLLKAYREVDAGRIRPEQARMIESRYRVKLPNHSTSSRFPGWTSVSTSGVTMPHRAKPDEQRSRPVVAPIPARATVQTTENSYEDLVEDLEEAAEAMFASDDAMAVATFPDHVIIGLCDDDGECQVYFDIPYSMDADGDPMLGAPKPLDAAFVPSATNATGRLATRSASTRVHKEPATMPESEQLTSVRAALTEAGASPDIDPALAIRTMHADIRRLTPLADDGRQYRADLVAQSIEEGVRAFGNDFAVERYTALLNRADTTINEIKGFVTDWKKVGDSRIPAGRSSSDTAESPPAVKEGEASAAAASRPNRAFAG